jgi:hypothetical protein
MNMWMARLLIGLFLLTPTVYAQKKVVQRRDSPIAKGLPIKCSGTDYTWTGMLREKENYHTLETTRDVNSTPLEVVILEKGEALMDNERFEIFRSNANETFAMFRDQVNLITVVLNYRYGTLLYSKVFTNAGIGKQNAMSFVAACKNY